MSFLCWNIRGAGVLKASEVRRCVKNENVKMVALIETQVERLSTRRAKQFCKFQNSGSAICPALGKSGGLFAFWDREFFSESRIQTGNRWICLEGRIEEWCFDCAILIVYGLYTRRDRQALWDELLVIKGNVSVPFFGYGRF